MSVGLGSSKKLGRNQKNWSKNTTFGQIAGLAGWPGTTQAVKKLNRPLVIENAVFKYLEPAFFLFW